MNENGLLARIFFDRFQFGFNQPFETQLKGLAPFTQLVKVRRGKLVLVLPSDFHETFTRSSLALNMSRKLLLDP